MLKICRRKHEYIQHPIPGCPICRKMKRAEWYKNNIVKHKALMTNWAIKNKEKVKIDRKIKYHKNKEKTKLKNKEWYQKNKKRKMETFKKWISIPENREKRNKRVWEYIKNREKNDPLFKLIRKIRTNIYRAFKIKKMTKRCKSWQMIGCSYEDLQNHLIQTAIKNYGHFDPNNTKYNIDHIIPLSSAKNEKELIKLQHYTNLQLLTEHHNKQKRHFLNWNLPI